MPLVPLFESRHDILMVIDFERKRMTIALTTIVSDKPRPLANMLPEQRSRFGFWQRITSAQDGLLNNETDKR